MNWKNVSNYQFHGNDANSAALGELAEGAGKNCDSMAFFVIGTGIAVL